MAEEELKPCDLATLETFEFERVLLESEWLGVGRDIPVARDEMCVGYKRFSSSPSF